MFNKAPVIFYVLLCNKVWAVGGGYTILAVFLLPVLRWIFPCSFYGRNIRLTWQWYPMSNDLAALYSRYPKFFTSMNSFGRLAGKLIFREDYRFIILASSPIFTNFLNTWSRSHCQNAKKVLRFNFVLKSFIHKFI